MNSGLITAALTAAAATVFTVWLCRAEGEAPALKCRPSVYAFEFPAERSLAGRRETSDPPAGEPDGISLRSKGGAVPRWVAPPSQVAADNKSSFHIVRTLHLPPSAVPVLPFAFRELPDGLELEPAQVHAVEAVQDQFIEAIGGEFADPGTPEYRRKWPNAQRIADLQLRARIGAQAFAAYQRQRVLRENSRDESASAR